MTQSSQRASGRARSQAPGGFRPAPGVWELDPTRCRAEATIRHALLTKVRGSFAVTGGTVVVRDNLRDCSVEATVAAGTVDTGDARRDEHLRGSGFLDVESFPEIRYQSTGVRDLGDGRFETSGELTIRGQTGPAVLVIAAADAPPMTDGRPRARFSASTEIEREEFGLSWNQTLETGGLLLGRSIPVVFAIEAVLRPERPA